MKKTAPAPGAIPIPYPQTPESAHAYIVAHGLCMSDLARQNNLSRYVLIDLLRGKRKGLRGDAHRGAILLGLKRDPRVVGRRVAERRTS